MNVVFKLKPIVLFLIVSSLCFICRIDCEGTDAGTQASNEGNFLDIIIDNTHAYTYFNYIDSNGFRYSLYSSLMPKNNGNVKNEEGIERFPTVLEYLLREEDIPEIASEVYEKSTGDDVNNNKEGLTAKELLSAFMFALYYMVSNHIKITNIGEIIKDRPDFADIKIRKRFYLTLEQAKKVKALINKTLKESLENKVVYDVLNHNCIDYVKEIYEGAGLDETQGEFLSQFDSYLGCNIFDDEQQSPEFTILKSYKAHTDGSLSPWRVLKAIWNATGLLAH